ncbi:MAG: hypothetical protein ACPGUC_02200 [Gammaproteobacteria bacterium]
MNVKRLARFILAAGLLTAASAHAGMFAVTDAGVLYEVESESGPVTTVGNTGVGGLQALTLATDGTLYTTQGSNLYTLNKSTGAASLIGGFGGGVVGVEGIAINAGGTLYAADGGTLYTIDTGTGTATFAGNTGIGWDDLAFAQADITFSGGTISAGTLLGLDATVGIYTIDTSTFVSTLVESVPVAVADEAFTTDGGGGVLGNNYDRESGGNSGFYEIDMSGGSADSFIIAGPGNVTGMALEDDGPPLPLPPVALLMGLGLAAMGRRLLNHG